MGTIDIIGSQLDVASIVSQMMQLERLPVYRMEDQVVSMQTKVNEYQNFNTKLSALANAVNMMLFGTSYAPLVSPTTYNNRLAKSVFAGSTATSSNENVLTATAFGGVASMGSYSIDVIKLAKAQTTVSTGFASASEDIGRLEGKIFVGGKTLDINLNNPARAQITTFTFEGAGSGETLGEGTVTLKTRDGSKEIEIEVGASDTLTDLMNSINDHEDNLGFFLASIVDGKLVVTTADTGADNGFTIVMESEDGFHEKFKYEVTQHASDKDDTLRALQHAINEAAAEAGVGINALIVNSGAADNPYKLMILSKESGEANSFTLGGDFIGPAGLQFTTTQNGEDAEMTINGIYVKSASNTVKSAIEGVDITLKNVGENITLEIGVDNDSIVSSVKEMIEAYNEVVSFINSQFRYDATLSGFKDASDYIKSQFKMTEITTGVLFGDSTLRTVQSRLQSIVLGSAVPVATDPNNPYRSMGQLGISVDRDGFLSLDENQLRKALSEDFDRTSKFFLGYETSDGKMTGGMLSNLGEALKGLTDPLRNPIKTAMDGLNNSISNVLKNIDDYERRLQVREDQLYAQFSAADEALRQMRVLLGSIGSSLASLSNMNNNN